MHPLPKVDPALFAFATPRERQIFEALNASTSARAAARLLGVNPSLITQALTRAGARAQSGTVTEPMATPPPPSL